MARAIITNPQRKSGKMALKLKPKKHSKKRRNPAPKTKIKYKTRTRIVKVRSKRRNPVPKRSHRRRRRNPSGKMRGILPMLTGTVLPIGGGMVLSLLGVRYVPAMVPARVRGLVPGAVGIALALFSRSGFLKNLGYGIAGGGILDLARQNIPMLALTEDTYLLQSPDAMQLLGQDPLNTLGQDPLNTLGEFDLL